MRPLDVPRENGLGDLERATVALSRDGVRQQAVRERDEPFGDFGMSSYKGKPPA